MGDILSRGGTVAAPGLRTRVQDLIGHMHELDAREDFVRGRNLPTLSESYQRGSLPGSVGTASMATSLPVRS